MYIHAYRSKMRKIWIAPLLAIILIVTLIVFQSLTMEKRLVIATTTSLYDTGLLDYIEDIYSKKTGVKLYFISVGTGQAILHAERGDADLILAHAPSSEAQFLEKGYGGARKIIAYNFFIIVGPSQDPAKIRNLNITEALRAIVAAGQRGEAYWVSRGDNSGTHVKELSLWSQAGINYTEIRTQEWYIESGTGMGKTLLIANEKNAYTLSDIGTFLKYKASNLIQLEPLIEAKKELINVYSVILLNPTKHPHINFNEAKNFLEFLISEEGQKIIEQYKINGHQLFYPAVKVLKEKENPTAQWIIEYAYINGTECPPQYRLSLDYLYEED